MIRVVTDLWNNLNIFKCITIISTSGH